MATKKAPGKLTLADLWDGTDPQEASNQLPAGDHTVRLNALTLKPDEKKGTAVFAEYEAIEGENEGKKLRQMYKLTDADGNKAQGMAFLMRDLALIGYEDVKGKKLEKTLKEISEEQPMVVISAKENGQYINAYLQGPADGDIENSEEEEEEAEIEVGSQVTGVNAKGKEIEGEVTKIKGDTITVEDEDGKEHKCELDDLELVEEEEEEEDEDEDEEEEEIEVGSQVTDGDIEGEVVSIKKDKAVVKDAKGKKHTLELDTLELADSEEEEEDADEEEDEIEEGDTVTFEDDDEEEQEGEVLSVKNGKAKVKVGKKTLTVDVEELTKVEDED